MRVLGLLGLFYAFPAVYGALGRVLTPELYLTGETDTVVLRLPEAAWPGLGGELLGALVAAGAFAAFMSTASGLLVSLAGTVTKDVRRSAARGATERRRRFRAAALGAMVVPALLALVARGLDISVLVDYKENITRFILISKAASDPEKADKTMIVFTLPNSPGALFKALSVFALRDIDLTKLESRPVRGRAFEYLFYADIAVPRQDLQCTRALVHLAEFAKSMRTLGSYTSWKEKN